MTPCSTLLRQDHFLGGFLNEFGHLRQAEGFEVVSEGPAAGAGVEGAEPGEVLVRVRAALPGGGAQVLRFALVRGEVGTRAGSFLVKSLLKE
jgi:hypothetical protein